jgi:hypothetical protein
MVYTVILKWLSFKQNIGDIGAMLNDEKSTYAILRYAMDIPQSIYAHAMDQLTDVEEHLLYHKLINLVKEYNSAAGIHMTMDEEIEETIELYYEDGMMKIRKMSGNEFQDVALLEDDDDDDDEEITIIRINK